jgi:predicted membrane chloride channel (bestrophin family)
MVGLTCVTALTLTFYPPTAYKRWVESRAQTTLATTH